MNALTTAQPVHRTVSEGGFAKSAKLEDRIKKNLEGIGYAL